jgi:hypothetical protein
LCIQPRKQNSKENLTLNKTKQKALKKLFFSPTYHQTLHQKEQMFAAENSHQNVKFCKKKKNSAFAKKNIGFSNVSLI